MLQQTQVETAVPYYLRFMSAFPSLKSVAEAPLEAVLKTWEGLGYYSRARNIQKSALRILDQHGGDFPDRLDDLVALPGIGRSTAGAILSLSFNKPFPILDGNVRRVLSRLFSVKLPAGTRLDKELWSLSSILVSGNHPRQFNSALMDLGATVCTPRNPLCTQCPLKKACIGLKENLQATLPMKVRKKPIPVRHHAAWIVWSGKRALIERRPEKGLWGGLWGFPEQPVAASSDSTEIPEPAKSLKPDFKVTRPRFLCRLRHAFTHFKLVLDVYETVSAGNHLPEESSERKWIAPSEMARLPFSSLHGRIRDGLGKSGPLTTQGRGAEKG